jgi:hypothetical protein
VRELQNEVMRALALGDGRPAGVELLSPRLRVARPMAAPASMSMAKAARSRISSIASKAR